MGLFGKALDWGVGYLGKGPKAWLGGRVDPFSDQLLDKWEKLADPDRGPGPAPWERNVARELNPGPGNPIVGGYLNRYGRALDAAGVNPAARAALLSRARATATGRVLSAASSAYGRFQSLATALQGARNRIDTTTPQGAFLSGFAQGGGGSALGQVGGYLGGGSGNEVNTSGSGYSGGTTFAFDGTTPQSGR